MRNESPVLTPLTRVRVTIPRPTVRTLYRRRLLHQLDRGPDRALTLVVGGPGCGKTLLVSAWAQDVASRAAETVAWVAAGRDCDDPAVLWSLVVAAWARSVPSMTTVQAPRVVGPAFVDEVLQHLEAVPGRCTLVLEDLHEVQSPEALATLDLMLASRPANLHVVMVTRSDPPLALHRLRLAGELTEIRTRDLAFTDDETTSMLTQHGVELTRDDHAHLMAKTEGWAAGIRLAAISLQDRPDPAEQSALIQAFAGSQRAIADYLVTEVLDRQPDRLREFLLRTCVVERVDARLANVLAETDDAAEALDTLERRGAFVTALDDATGWYRFHRLFGEMCRHQLEVRSPALVPDLHARAARWFAETGEANEALRHAIQSRDWDLVGRVGVLVAGGQTFGHEGRGTRAALRAIPEDAAPDNAWIAFAHALGCDDSGEVVDLEQRLAVADGVLARDPEAPPVLLGLSHLLARWPSGAAAGSARRSTA